MSYDFTNLPKCSWKIIWSHVQFKIGFSRKFVLFHQNFLPRNSQQNRTILRWKWFIGMGGRHSRQPLIRSNTFSFLNWISLINHIYHFEFTLTRCTFLFPGPETLDLFLVKHTGYLHIKHSLEKKLNSVKWISACFYITAKTLRENLTEVFWSIFCYLTEFQTCLSLWGP